MTPTPDRDPLEDLRERVRATQEAAERLTAGPPPAGWATPHDEDRRAFEEEVRALAALVGTLRDLVPPELREQVTELVRQLLLVLRALIDWWVERIEQPARGDAPAVEEIPIT